MICTEREIRWLFGNFDDILQVQRELLASLEHRYCSRGKIIYAVLYWPLDVFLDSLRIWGPTQIISDVFQSWVRETSTWNRYCFENTNGTMPRIWTYFISPREASVPECLSCLLGQLRCRGDYVWTTHKISTIQKVYWCKSLFLQTCLSHCVWLYASWRQRTKILLLKVPHSFPFCRFQLAALIVMHS